MFKNRRLPQVAYYILSIMGTIAALKLTLFLEPILKGQHLFIYLVVVILCAIYGGLGPGLTAAVLSTLLHDYFGQNPKFSLRIHSRADLFDLVIFIASATFVSWVASITRRARKNAEDASKSLEDMVAIVSHDLKTPLTSIVMNVHLLSRKLEKKELKTHLDQITKAVGRMTNLINSVLDLEKIKQGRFEMDLAIEDPRNIVSDIVSLMDPIAKKKNIEIKSTGPIEVKPIRCDREKIYQALTNLIGNSLKFTPEGGAVSCSIEDDANAVRFSVKDSGPGISKEDVPLVFNRYWQASRTAKKGNGLGLYITKGIVEAHGGQIDVKSELGIGTEFSFTIPRN
jgi:signal transduction histidine kinase